MSESWTMDRSSAAPPLASGLFPVTHSILSADALLAKISEAYAFDSPATCHLIMPGMNDTYLLTGRNERYIARVYRVGWRTPSEIAYELELLTHLAAKGVAVSAPIAARDGRLARPLAAPEGIRRLVLFTYTRGRPPSWEEEEHCYLAGRLAANIHAASDDFVSQHGRFCLDLEYLIDRPLAALRPFLGHRTEDRAYLEGLGDRLRERLAGLRGELDWGICHGDLSSTGNFHIAEDHTLGVFDFDLCGPGWRAYDLAPIQRAARGYRKRGIWDAFILGYTATRRLAPADVAAIPLFHAINRIWSLGMRAANVAKWGSLCMGDWYIESQLAFFREWEAQYLKGAFGYA